MGCAPSSPQDVDMLPIKAQCRTAFSRSSTSDRPIGTVNTAEKQQGRSEEGAVQPHDVVLCYPLGGTVFGLELQARYEKLDSVSVWTPDHYTSLPGSPDPSKSGSRRPRPDAGAPAAPEIKPVPEGSPDSTVSAPNQLLAREVRTCRRGVLVLLTAGCTWDDAVLCCLRLVSKHARPLVLVHCCASCPLPDLAEWPPDVRPLVAAAGAPVKYLSQHAAEALREVERRMLAAAAAAGTTAAAQGSAAVDGKAGQPQEQKQTGKLGLLGGGGGAAERLAARLRLQSQQPAAAVPAGGGEGAATAAAEEACGSLSLAALQASNAALCSRATQLLAQWSSSAGSREAEASTLAATPVLPPPRPSCAIPSRPPSTTTTLVEALPSSWNNSPTKPLTPPNLFRAGVGAPGAEGCGGSKAGLGVEASLSQDGIAAHGPSSRQRPLQQHDLQPPPLNLPWRTGQPLFQTPSHADGSGIGSPADQQGPSPLAASGAGAGAAACRCALRYRDGVWATPVAFLCAQLEEELGRGGVCIQPPAGPATSPSSALAPAPPATGLYPDAAAALATAQRMRQGPAAMTPYGGAGSGIAAVPVSAASSVCGGRPETASPSTSAASRVDGGDINGSVDELVLFTGPLTEECALAAASPSTSPPAPALAPAPKAPPGPGPGAGAERALASASAAPATRSRSRNEGWDLDPGDPPLPSPSVAAGAASDDVTCVYFVTPGLTTPAACLAAVASELGRGRRLVLVADGEACQRLADQAPAGVSAEAWKVVKRLWSERLMYVQDYHAPFAELLRQGLAAAETGAAAGAAR